MTQKVAAIKARVDACMSHICFEYNGKEGVIDPYYDPGKGYFFPMLYDGKETVVRTADAVMDTPFFDGRSLAEIAEEIVVTEW